MWLSLSGGVYEKINQTGSIGSCRSYVIDAIKVLKQSQTEPLLILLRPLLLNRQRHQTAVSVAYQAVPIPLRNCLRKAMVTRA